MRRRARRLAAAADPRNARVARVRNRHLERGILKSSKLEPNEQIILHSVHVPGANLTVTVR